MIEKLQNSLNESSSDFLNLEAGKRTTSELICEFTIAEEAGFDRVNELIRFGLPVPVSSLETEHLFLPSYVLYDSSAAEIEVEVRTLEKWPNGTAKWLELVMPVSLKGNQNQKVQLRRINTPVPASDRAEAFQVAQPCFALRVETHKNCIHFFCNNELHTLAFELMLPQGPAPAQISWDSVKVVADLGLSNRFQVKGLFKGPKRCELSLDIFFNRLSSELTLSMVLHNPRAAIHPKGFWDLGDKNSELIRGFSLVQKIGMSATACEWQIDDSTDLVTHDLTETSSLRQFTSGGNSTSSKVHLRADGTLPDIARRGFEFSSSGSSFSGARASPTVTIRSAEVQVAQSMMSDFWQKFPSEVEVDGDQVRWIILPSSDTLHELQPGEKTSRTFAFCFSSIGKSLHLRHPLVVHISENSLERSEALDWSSRYSDETSEYEDYATRLLTGPNSFEAKREAIDEFGWRNYGDVWADHEEPFAEQPGPVISHYNNQYDLLNGFLRAYVASGDVRWRNLAFPLANHVLDIDLYDTHEDRPVFNGGLFWHTAHYLHAGTSSHRSQSLQMSFAPKHRVNGTGPGSNEHNYTTGLKLYFELTGDQRAKAAILRMAHWVLALDDSEHTVLAPFSGLPTGRASSTASASYHGPGRGVGNSINCLLDAWQLSGDKLFLEKCNNLIKRVVHPADDVAKLNLLDAEMRWSYTVCLQSLAKYLVIRTDTPDYMFGYVLGVLRQYGRWMTLNEDSYFTRVNELEFPTETWHAQDLRKANMLHFISGLLLDPKEKLAAQTIAKKIHGLAWEGLRDSKTWYFTRPAAIVLQQWPINSFLHSEALSQLFEKSAHIPDSQDFGKPVKFVSQQNDVSQSIKDPVRALKMLSRSFWLPHWKPVLKHIRTKIKQL